MKRFARWRGIFMVVCLAFTCAQAWAESVPQLINYQGMLTDKDGNPVKTGEYKLSFNIYSTSSAQGKGDKLLWGPQTFSQVPVVRGNFNVLLGPQDSSKRNISDTFKYKDTFVEISINGQIIAPRQQILSAPYAMEAAHALNATNANNGRNILHIVPPLGSIIAWHKSMTGTPSLQDGWVECNGQTINDAASPYNGRTIPNLNSNNTYKGRGLFLRGGISSGTYQDDYLEHHVHSYSGYFYPDIVKIGNDICSKIDKSGQIICDYEFEIHNYNFSSVTTGTIVESYPYSGKSSTETCPVNMSVVWIMRIK